MKVHILSDIHGNMDILNNAIQKTDQDLIIQIGDFGFADNIAELNFISPDKLKIVGGNHDEYPELIKYPHYLGDWGIIPGFDLKVGFLRGAYSVDKEYRVPGFSWWSEEELTMPELWYFLDWYEKEKPDIMLSHCSTITGLHTCITPFFGYSRTETILEEAFKIHSPKIHIHGHLHVSKRYKVGVTDCYSLGINELIEFDF